MASVQQQQQHQEEPPPPTSTSTAPPTAITTLASKPPRPRLTPLPFDLPPRSGSPVLPAAAASFRPISVLPQGYEFPEEALAPEMHQRLVFILKNGSFGEIVISNEKKSNFPQVLPVKRPCPRLPDPSPVPHAQGPVPRLLHPRRHGHRAPASQGVLFVVVFDAR